MPRELASDARPPHDPRRGSPFGAPQDAGEAARLHDFRADTFGAMVKAAARWQAIAIVPFQVFVLLVLAAFGESRVHLGLQGLVLLACLFAAFGPHKARRQVPRVEPPPLLAFGPGPLLGAATYFLSIANTGGLASPLLVTGIPMLLPMSTHPVLVAQRRVAVVFFVVGFLVMGALSATPVGLLDGALRPHAGWTSHEYILLAIASCLVTVAGVTYMGGRFAAVADGLSRELAARREELFHETEDRTRSLEGVAARLAHEVKNPLAAIKGLSTHMVRKADDPKVQERLRIVAQEADRLQAIVDGFLSFSRGLDDVHPQAFPLTEACEALVVLLELRARESGVLLRVVEGRPAGTVIADPRKLRQALLNLLLNGIHAASLPGAGEPREVRMEVSGDDDHVTIVVADTGLGMSAETLERIKRPYFTTKDGGSGLGIAVARAQIEQHGGTLAYESNPGAGTRATIRLPRDARPAVRASLTSPTAPTSSKHP